MSRFATAVVTAVNPLRVAMDGDPTHPIPALPKTYSTSVGQRLRVEVRRSGLLPLVQGPV